jgi:hypothetical protein
MELILKVILSVLLSSSVAMAQLGNDKGNGGDILSGQDPMYGIEELQAKVLNSIDILDTTSMGQLGAFLVWFDGAAYPFFGDAPTELVGHGLHLRTLFQNLRENVKIEYVTTPLCAPQASGSCRPADALNDRKTMTIKINIARARLLSEVNILRLLLHEYISIFGYEKSFDYKVSSYIFKHIAWWSHLVDKIPFVAKSGYGIGTWRSEWSFLVHYAEVFGQDGRCKKSFHSGIVPLHVSQIGYFETSSVPLDVYCVMDQVYVQAETPDMISKKVAFRGARGYNHDTQRWTYKEAPFSPYVIPDFDTPTNFFEFPVKAPHFYAVPIIDDWNDNVPRYEGPKKITRRLFR